MTLHPISPPFKTPPEEADAIDAKVSVWQMQIKHGSLKVSRRLKMAEMIVEGQRCAAYLRAESARIK